jgi:hypothetical protein
MVTIHGGSWRCHTTIFRFGGSSVRVRFRSPSRCSAALRDRVDHTIIANIGTLFQNRGYDAQVERTETKCCRGRGSRTFTVKVSHHFETIERRPFHFRLAPSSAFAPLPSERVSFFSWKERASARRRARGRSRFPALPDPAPAPRAMSVASRPRSAAGGSASRLPPDAEDMILRLRDENLQLKRTTTDQEQTIRRCVLEVGSRRNGPKTTRNDARMAGFPAP